MEKYDPYFLSPPHFRCRRSRSPPKGSLPGLSSTNITTSYLSTVPHARARLRALNHRLFSRPSIHPAKRVPQKGRRIAVGALLHHHVGDHRPHVFGKLGSDLRFGRDEMFLLINVSGATAFRGIYESEKKLVHTSLSFNSRQSAVI